MLNVATNEGGARLHLAHLQCTTQATPRGPSSTAKGDDGNGSLYHGQYVAQGGAGVELCWGRVGRCDAASGKGWSSSVFPSRPPPIPTTVIYWIVRGVYGALCAVV